MTVFGPVKKFRPVVCRSVEKETSLHGSLMEAIQSGRGKDGLKKVRWDTAVDGVDECCKARNLCDFIYLLILSILDKHSWSQPHNESILCCGRE